MDPIQTPVTRAFLTGIVLLLATVLPVQADKRPHQQLADDAVECAALFWIVTAYPAPDDDGYMAATFTGLTMMMGQLYGLHEGHRLGKTLTNGDVGERRDEATQRLADRHDANDHTLPVLYKRCFAWYQQIAMFGQRAGLGPASTEAAIEAVLHDIPERPASYDLTDVERAQVKTILRESFAAWEASGRLTPRRLREQLGRDILDSLPAPPNSPDFF